MCRREAAAHSRRKFRFRNKLMSLDGSIIDLSATMFDWAKYRQRKGAIKLHLLLDHNVYLPSFAVVTEGKRSEPEVARSLHGRGRRRRAHSGSNCPCRWCGSRVLDSSQPMKGRRSR
jgi:hypothetical protein